MNQITKYIGLLALLPLLTVPLTIDYAVADTAQAKGHPGGNVVAFGDKTKHIVCGDRLCSEYPGGRAAYESETAPIEKEEKETNPEGPYVEQFGISALGENMYKVTFTVYAGNEDLQEELLQVSSDISQKEAQIPNLFADSHTYVPVLIQADDPSTINAEIAN